jgi:cysteine desulfurase
VLGAGHEHGLRPGTENVAYIVGLGVACELASQGLDQRAARMQRLRDELWERLAAQVPGLGLNGDPVRRLPNTLSVRFPGASGNEVLAGATAVAASTGSACHAGQESAPGVILAMGISEADALGTVRLTLGRETTVEDVSRAADALIASWHLARSSRL